MKKTDPVITPPYLQAGDAVALVAPARSIGREAVEPALKIFKAWDLKVVTGANLFSQYHQFAGSDLERARNMQQMLDDEKVKAIFCARGGYGTIRILEHLDFSHFAQHPKWLVGFSDITVLHAYINEKLNIKTLHAEMPVNFPKDAKENTSMKYLKALLWGNIKHYDLDNDFPVRDQSRISGKLTGGNLSVLCSLSGTPYDMDTNGNILFLEEVDEYLYHLDRMMMNFKLSGKLNNLKALIVGSMTEMKDNSVPFGKSACDIILDATKEFDFPVLTGFPSGHSELNMPLILGGIIQISKKEGGIKVTFAD